MKQIYYKMNDFSLSYIVGQHSVFLLETLGDVRWSRKTMLDGNPREVFKYYKELERIGLAAPQVTYL